MNVTKKHVAITLAERRKRSAKATIKTESYTPVALEVSPTEVIPLICSTKGHHVKIQSPRSASGSENALKFYLVDCRPASTAKEQGRFPTSVELSPEKLQDPDALQHLTDMFESLRGAVHICVMGEGFASFPTLYDHPLTKGEGKLLEDDISRTSSCALFFLKKGFPFVSVLKGGFAAAHAFLSRNGPSLDLAPSDVLIDYDPVVSLFAQLEVARQEQEEYKNAPAREKTVRTLQKIIDSSMTRLTVEEQRINDLASDLSKPETVDKMKQSVSNFFARAHQHTPSTQRDESSLSFGRTPPLFMSKKLSEAKKDEEAKEKLTTNQDDALVNSLSRFTEKMSFKRQHENTDLSATGSSNEIVDTDQIESITPKENDTTPESNKVKATEGHSAMSNAFSSFAQRIQHSHKPAPPPSENKEMLSGENAMAKDSTESKTLPTAQLGQAKSSFSLFAQKIAAAKQRDASKAAAATPTGITATDNAEKPESRENILDDKNESDNLPTVQPEQAKSSFSMFAGKIAAIKAASATATATATEDPTTGSGPTLESQDHDSVEKAELVEPSSVKTNLSPTVQPEQAKSSFSMFAERIAGIKAASATATATATEDPTTGSGPTLESQYHDSEGKADLVEPSSVKTNPSSTVQLEQAKSSFSMFTQKIAIMKTVSTTATVDSATVDPANISGETPESQDHDSEEKGEVVETSPIKANLAASKNLFSTFASKIAEVKSSEGNSDAAQGKSEPTKNPFANFSLKKSTNQQTSNPSIIETNSTTANAESTSNDGTETTTKKTFASFTKSFGSGNQNQAANRNPFASLMQSKADTAKEGEASSISTKLSLGKFLSEQNDPFGPSSFGFKGKTRFSSPNTSTETKSAKTDAISASEEAISYQHDDEEEAISFQHEDDDDDEQEVIDLLGGDVFEADSSTSMEAESQVENQTNDLFLGLDPQPHGDPMKDLFGDDPFGVVEEN